MGDNSVNESITIEDDSTESDNKNNFSDVINNMGEIIANKYPDKLTNLSDENINGLIRLDILVNYTHRNFNYEYNVLTTLRNKKEIRVLSKQGFLFEKLIEFVKSIQATFEQTQIPDGMRGLLRR